MSTEGKKITRADIIREAREYMSTPWSHQGRLKHIGVDCAGLCLETGKTLGLIPRDSNANAYGREPNPFLMRRTIEQFVDKVPKTELKPGDILWMKAGDRPQHLGIYAVSSGHDTLIHAPLDGQVEEMPLDEAWRKKIVAVYRFRNLDD